VSIILPSHFQIDLHDLHDWNLVVDKVKLENKTLILLEGDLGAGKTTFVSYLCKAKNIDLVASPTYAIIHHYHNQQFSSIYHVDLYRLENEDDIQSSGFWDLFQQTQSIIIVEWPSRIAEEEWPLDWNIIKIKITKQEEFRKVTIQYGL